MTIDTVESLRGHLQTAIEIEHSTLPPYLCALYSIEEGSNREAAEVIQSVVLEEMLHLTMAANLLNSIGGEPVLDSPAVLPAHPTFLPHSDESIEVSLGPLSAAALETFMAIEHPGPVGSIPEDDRFETIGQFYAAVEEAFERLTAELGEEVLFCGDPSRQVTDALYYGGAGRIIAVYDLASAKAAMEEIVEQGEGLDHGSILDGDKDMFHPERDEVAHYFRFHELLVGRRYAPGDTPETGPTGEPLEVDWSAIHAMTSNPRAADQEPGSEARLAMDGFNRSYCDVLRLLEACFNGSPDLLAVATGAMYGIKGQATNLMRLAAEGAPTGPGFEWVPPDERIVEGITIYVIPDGPYVIDGEIAVHNAEGELLKSAGPATICRCGGSHTKPFCDGTHARIGFDGTETADHGEIADRRDAYPTPDGLTIYDDRHRCAHFGQCTSRLPAAFGVSEDAFVDPTAAPSHALARVTAGCPSGALAFALRGETEAVEHREAPGVHPIVDGPYRLRGGIQVMGTDENPYEVRERQTLCRCGKSRNKPFCDGSHWYAGFRDPLPPELEGAETFPWDDPESAERGRERYAAEQAAKADGGRP